MFLRKVVSKVMRSEGALYKTTMLLSYFIQAIFALIPITKICMIYEMFIILWVIAIIGMSYEAISQYFIQNESGLNSLISSILFMAHVVGHLAVLMESWKMRKYRIPLFEKFVYLEKTMEDNFKVSLSSWWKSLNNRVVAFIWIFISMLIFAHGLIIWTTFNVESNAGSLYLYSLQSFLALQFKTFEFLIAIIHINYHAQRMRELINEIGERNLERIFGNVIVGEEKIIKVYSPRQEQEDEGHIGIYKTAYNELYATICLINAAYGWSLLTLTAVYFIDFVCNTFWILVALLDVNRNYYVLLQNGCFALLAFMLLSFMCWYCDKADYESRYIGCFISKLVKQPLGNKRYNDLVSEFSIQTLHQRFIITAKEFFTLNLGLLGSMVAAIVTYLVILIQFMFTEKNNRQRIHEAKMLETTTSMAIIALQNVTGFNDKYPTVADNLNDIARAVNHTVLANIKN
uniref:Gustatory receptor n=1 Tax=Stomoxys calcitrans TaxID=35570 RepID=A0A2Y9D4D2_STOCA